MTSLSPVNVLLVVRRMKTGGIEKATLNLAEGLLEKGHHVHLMILKGKSELPLPAELEVHYCDLDKRSRKNPFAFLFDIVTRGILRFCIPGSGFVWRGILTSRMMRKQVKNFESTYGAFDLILLRGQGVFENLWRFKHPALWQVVEGPPTHYDRFYFGGFLYRCLFHQKRIITVSDGIWNVLNADAKKFGVEVAEHLTIYNALPIQKIRELAVLPASDIPDEPYFVHVARLNPVKDQDLLLRAYAKSKLPFPLVIVGDGNLRSSLVALSKSLGIESKVRFLGRKENPYPYMAHAQAFILSSKQEGLGLVLIESLACGTQTVSVDVPGGIREVMIGDLQRLIAEHSEEALARKMRESVDVPVAVNPEWADRFDNQRIIPQFINLARKKNL